MEKNTEKQEYKAPVISHIVLDNEISLQMTSNPPGYSNEAQLNAPEYLKSDPFKNDIA